MQPAWFLAGQVLKKSILIQTVTSLNLIKSEILTIEITVAKSHKYSKLEFTASPGSKFFSLKCNPQ